MFCLLIKDLQTNSKIHIVVIITTIGVSENLIRFFVSLKFFNKLTEIKQYFFIFIKN